MDALCLCVFERVHARCHACVLSVHVCGMYSFVKVCMPVSHMCFVFVCLFVCLFFLNGSC